MEELISEVERYAQQRGIKPATVLQNAAGLSGRVWSRWLEGAQCTLATAERVREYMMQNPVSAPSSEAS